ncbi:MAG: hypothetical protein QOF44_6038, partial [Streptomyces sp.]|nr:hypothetical protein [Streptomyces sp.]
MAAGVRRHKLSGEVPGGDPRKEGGEVATLRALNVGMPKDVPWHGKTVHTGVYKKSVTGPR